MEDAPEHQRGQNEPGRGALDAEGKVASVSSGHPYPVTARHLQSNLRPGVPGAHDHDVSLAELCEVPVLARMQLDDCGIQLPSERRYPGPLVSRHGHHNVLGLQLQVPGSNEIPASSPPQSVYFEAGPNRQLKVLGVSLEVVRHLILGGELMWPSGERHTRESIETCRCE